MNWKITQIKTLDNPETGIIVNASFSVSDGTATTSIERSIGGASISCIGSIDQPH